MSRIYAITGAFGALGQALTVAAAASGARLALIDFAESPAFDLGLGDQALALGGVDLTDPAAAQRAITTAAEHFGGLDALFNLAGGFRWEGIEDGSSETFALMQRMNLVTCVNASRASLVYLKQSAAGRIVNVGANAALRAGLGMGAYAAAKAGVHRLTESLAEELKACRVTVNAVLPSILDTPANRKDMPQADFGAWVAPADLAAVMLFLGGEAAGAVTGALVPVVGRL